MLELQFRPRVWPTLVTLLGVLVFAKLGLWQHSKAQVRAAEIARFSARALQGPYQLSAQGVASDELQDAPVLVQGVFEPQAQFYVDNRQENGVPGVHVVTPLRMEDGQTRVLVNRGWIAWPGGSRQALPQAPVPPGLVAVQGVGTVPVHKEFLLMPAHAERLARLWPRLDLARFTAEQSYPVLPVVVLQTSDDSAPALLRRWPAPENRVARHQSYAYQWFGMALALLVFYGVASVRRRNTL